MVIGLVRNSLAMGNMQNEVYARPLPARAPCQINLHCQSLSNWPSLSFLFFLSAAELAVLQQWSGVTGSGLP